MYSRHRRAGTKENQGDDKGEIFTGMGFASAV